MVINNRLNNMCVLVFRKRNMRVRCHKVKIKHKLSHTGAVIGLILNDWNISSNSCCNSWLAQIMKQSNNLGHFSQLQPMLQLVTSTNHKSIQRLGYFLSWNPCASGKVLGSTPYATGELSCNSCCKDRTNYNICNGLWVDWELS
jgi:hypothetical protein